MDKILFLYDDKMLETRQKQLELPCVFLSFAQTKAKKYFFNDTKKKGTFIMPKENGITTKTVIGAIFLVREYELHEHKFASCFYNSSPFTGRTEKADIFTLMPIIVTPIKFSTYEDFILGKYTKGKDIVCETFGGNITNSKVKRSIDKCKYYSMKGVDHKLLLETIKEKNEKQGEMKNGLE